MKADVSEYTGVVLPCPICNDRSWHSTTANAWRWLYYHLRNVHREPAKGKITQMVIRNYMNARDSSEM